MFKKFSGTTLVLLISFYCISLFTGVWGPIAQSESWLFEQVYTRVTGQPTALNSVSNASEYRLESSATQYPAWLFPLTDWLSSPTPGQTAWFKNDSGYFLATAVEPRTSDQILQFKAPGQLVIGDQKINTSFDGHILTPYSNASQQPAYVPWWQCYSTVVLGTVWLVFMYWCYARRNATLLVSSVIALPVLSQLVNVLLLMINHWWLLLLPLYLAVLLAAAVYLRLIHVARQLDAAQQNLVLDRAELYGLRLDRQELDRVYDHVKKHGASQPLLPQIYELAQGLERKRSYDKAKQVYQIIQDNGGFQDTETRLQHLQQVDGQVSGLPDMQQTLVLDGAQLHLPELGRYQLIRELGRGSMGVVYLAKDPKINRELAIKTVRFDELSDDEIESVKQRFFREAQAAGRLNHPNIVTVFDVGEEKDLAYIAMDYVKGEPLSRYGDENNLLDFREIFAAFAKVAHALQFAHESEIIHRDIKPSNILYQTDTRTVKVSDFGIARMNDNRQTQTGIVLGSPSYMSPEQIRGEMLSGQSDIFSLGVSLYQLLTGHLPFAGENLPALAYAITQLKHRNVRDYRPELPTAATRIINKALQKEPDKRFTDAAQMARALAKAALENN